MNKKPFLPERASINLSQALNSDRGSGSSWSRFFKFFPFSPTLKMGQICKNLEKSCRKFWKKLIAENKEKHPKTPPKRFLTRLERQLCFGMQMSVIPSSTFMHFFSTIWVREVLVKFWAQIRTHRLAECTWKWQNEKSLGIEPFTQIEGLKPFLRSFGVFFLVFGDQLFSEFSTRFFEIFAYLAHF